MVTDYFFLYSSKLRRGFIHSYFTWGIKVMFHKNVEKVVNWEVWALTSYNHVSFFQRQKLLSAYHCITVVWWRTKKHTVERCKHKSVIVFAVGKAWKYFIIIINGPHTNRKSHIPCAWMRYEENYYDAPSHNNFFLWGSVYFTCR